MPRTTPTDSQPKTKVSNTTTKTLKGRTSHNAPDHGTTHSPKPANCGTPKRRIGLEVSYKPKEMKPLAITLRYFVAFAALLVGSESVLTYSQDDLERHNTRRNGFCHLTLRSNLYRRSLFTSREYCGRVTPTRDNERRRKQPFNQRLPAIQSTSNVHQIQQRAPQRQQVRAEPTPWPTVSLPRTTRTRKRARQQ